MRDKYQIAKMRAGWIESLFPFDDFVELKNGKWLADSFPELSERSEYACHLRDATEQEEKIWEAFNTLANLYFKK